MHALHWAVAKNNLPMVVCLLEVENNAMLDLPTAQAGDTPIMVALRHGCEDIAEYLTERTANILARNRQGQAVYEVASTPTLRKRYTEKFELMSGASLNTLNYAPTYQEHYQRAPAPEPAPEARKGKGRRQLALPLAPTAAEEERSRLAEQELLAMLEAEETDKGGKKKSSKKKKKG
ncbi:hypothetical protein B484DRAFT_451029 [Ochromonadaceae sp. CCMP2298]|nr:hypothetical protein B484DRAFT_451029 [Ochromonadaceae sp. CCMP2298]